MVTTFLALAVLSLAEAPERLPGTQPLTQAGDLASAMVDGIDRFLLRKIDESASKRPGFWNRRLTSALDWDRSIEGNRQRLCQILGLRDRPAKPPAAMEILSDTRHGPTIAEDDTVRMVAVRWDAFRDVHGEGLMLIPKGKNIHLADVVAIPDSTQSPEALCGLVPGVAEESRFPLRLARSGCRVLVPALVDRGLTPDGIPDREHIYRSAFELGRHVIGHEMNKVLAALRWFESDRESPQESRPIGLIGYGDGGMLALYASAVQPTATATCVSGYFGDRSRIWTEPVDRNVFGLLERFGDAEVAAMIAPRPLILEASQVPNVAVPPGGKAAPGSLAPQDGETVRAEARRADALVQGLPGAVPIEVVGDGHRSFGSSESLALFLNALRARLVLEKAASLPPAIGPVPDPAARAARGIRELERLDEDLLGESAGVREAFFKGLDTSSPDAYRKTIGPYRKTFEEAVIGKFDDPLVAPNPKSRKVFAEPKFTGYEVTLDVFPDVFAFGILLVPKGIKPGERRPVVVCQHGLEGRPSDVADPRVNNPAYNQFAVRLAERGFITFSPQNPYIFHDRFRTLQRKANPLGKSLFSIIIPQHRQIVAWLKTLEMVDPARIGFYGLSYGGKSAMRIPAAITDYCLSICSADFNEWVWKNATTRSRYSYVWTAEYEIFEFDLGSTFNYAEMAALIAPRPFMVERGHFDGVAPDEAVAYEYAKVRRLYAAKLGIPEKTEIEFFVGPHTIHGVGTFRFLHRHLNWPEPTP
ncbi:alpha/beta hydrolase family protein [Aquisphaera insulae]|uniref:alpha/beta hydrolase family protein n=1 Tax=Aquisphaera insulae TaxID=2712864 RepID=UPI0013EB334E|nr:dienelactone hydrolase family protein [Aquisphaera insulae]